MLPTFQRREIQKRGDSVYEMKWVFLIQFKIENLEYISRKSQGRPHLDGTSDKSEIDKYRIALRRNFRI